MNTDPLATKVCNNIFLEDDGFCTRCGQNHLRLREKQTRRVAIKTATTTLPIFDPKPKVTKVAPQDNLQNEIERVIRETVETLAELYEVSFTLEFRYRRNGSFCKHHPTGRHEIVIGRCSKWFYENGYLSYRKNCQYTAMSANGGYLPQKMDAVKTHAAHEVAHAIVHDDGYPREMHGKKFLARFAEVLELVL